MTQTTQKLFSHPARPEWGRGLLVAERDKLLVLMWEDGQEHLVAATHRDKLAEVALDDAERTALIGKLQGVQAARSAQAARPKSKSSSRRPSRPVVPVMSFDAQMEIFERAYPGGFGGARFQQVERGVDGAGPKAGGREWAVARAAEVLASAAFADPAAVFESVISFLRPPLTMVHPMEGAIPLKAMKDEARTAFVDSLRELLHGGGDYGERFDRFVGAVQLTEKDGKARRPGWPLVTLLPALVHPGDHLFVKPQLLQKQANILGMRIAYQSAPTAAIYREFLGVGRALEGKLRDRGQAPRDLMDVASFVWTTLSPNSPDAPPPPAPPSDDEDDD